MTRVHIVNFMYETDIYIYIYSYFHLFAVFHDVLLYTHFLVSTNGYEIKMWLLIFGVGHVSNFHVKEIRFRRQDVRQIIPKLNRFSWIYFF